MVDVNDLPIGSNIKVTLKCDICGKMHEIPWYVYQKKYIEKYLCRSCKLKTSYAAGLKKSKRPTKSLEMWCKENNRQDILDSWNYELNKDITPADIGFGSHKSFYFTKYGTTKLREIYNVTH